MQTRWLRSKGVVEVSLSGPSVEGLNRVDVGNPPTNRSVEG